MIVFSREAYLGNKDKKPNDHCIWNEHMPPYGWLETDEHFRNRIKTHLENRNDQ